MNRIASLLLFILPALALPAAGPIAEADSAYTAGDFARARELYLDAAKTDGTSAELLYNIGNTYFRLGQPGRAILYYERALRLNPAMDEARANLEFVNSRITDRPGERGTFLSNALDSAANAMASNAWGWIAVGAFLLAVAGAVLYFFTTGVTLRKTGFFGSGAMILLSAIALFFAFRAAALAEADNVAIVTAGSTILSTAPHTPAQRSEEAMLLHEGTRVEILDSVATPADTAARMWLDVRVDNEHRAWLNAAHAERVVTPKH